MVNARYGNIVKVFHKQCLTYITYVAFDLASAESIKFVLELKRLDILGYVPYKQTHLVF